MPERIGDFKRWYLSRAEPGHELSVRYVEVDGIVAPHTHLTEETIFYLEGTGTASIGRKDVKITPGTMIVVPRGLCIALSGRAVSPCDTLRYS